MTFEVDSKDEIGAFIVEGRNRLRAISMNDYGFALSARLAQTYLRRASHVLDSKKFHRALHPQADSLISVAGALSLDYVRFEKFCADCERFDRRETNGAIEWVSKCAVRLLSQHYRARASRLLARRIRDLHARMCLMLTGS